MSDLEKVDIMFGNYLRNIEGNEQDESEVNVDSGSNRPQQNSNIIRENFRSLLSINSRENSEMILETTRMMSDEIANHVSRRLTEIRLSLNSQIQDVISTTITEKVLPFIQNTLDVQGRKKSTIMDQRSSGRHRNPEVGIPQIVCGTSSKLGFTCKSQRFSSKKSSIDSQPDDQDHDTVQKRRTTIHQNSILAIM